jgi:hypothetical protein
MSKTLKGGRVAEEAAAVIELERKNGKSGGEAISDALISVGRKRYCRQVIEQHIHNSTTNQTTINEAPRAGWFNNWFQNNKLLVALRAKIGEVKIPLEFQNGFVGGLSLGLVIAAYFVWILLSTR